MYHHLSSSFFYDCVKMTADKKLLKIFRGKKIARSLKHFSFTMIIGSILVLTIVVVILTTSSLVSKNRSQLVITGKTMGTYFRVKIPKHQSTPLSNINNDFKDFKKPLENIFVQELHRLNKLFSTYDPTSQISQFNQAQQNQPIKLDREFIQLLDLSFEINAITDKVFDPTISPLIDAWGFGFKSNTSENDLPLSSQHIDQLLNIIGLNKLIVDHQNLTVTKTISELQLNLSAIAKGLAVDRLSNILLTKKIDNHFVDIGGEIKAMGLNNLKPWTIGITTPDPNHQKTHYPKKIISLHNQCVSTSGDYYNYLISTKDGRIYSHIIDPRNGYPVKHSGISVSVVTDNCTQADGLSTALLILGSQRGLEISNTLNIRALFIEKNTSDDIDNQPKHSFQTLSSNAWNNSFFHN